MDIRKAVAVALLAAGTALGSAGAAFARSYVDIEVGPPPPRYEVVPAPRPGYIWVPGTWVWQGHRHVWHRGHWMHERPGYAYVEPRWHRYGERWRYDEGRWERRHDNRHYGRDRWRDDRHYGRDDDWRDYHRG